MSGDYKKKFTKLLILLSVCTIINKSRTISSVDRVADFESVGRGFESLMVQ